MKNFQKGSVAMWIVIVVVLLIFGGVLYYKDMEDSMTYNNYGLSFKYPSGWSVRDSYEPYSKNVGLSLYATSSQCLIEIESLQRTAKYGDTKILSFSDFLKGFDQNLAKEHSVSTVNNVSGFGMSGSYEFPYMNDKVLTIMVNGPENPSQQQAHDFNMECAPIVDNLVKTLTIEVQ